MPEGQSSIINHEGLVVRAWSDAHLGTQDIYIQAYDDFGIPQWGNEPLLVSREEGAQTNPQLVNASDGNVIVYWNDNFIEPNSNCIRAAKIAADGSVLWKSKPLCKRSNENTALIRKATDEQGGIYFLSIMDHSLYAVHINSNGNSVWGNNPHLIKKNCYTLGSSVSDGQGGFVVFAVTNEGLSFIKVNSSGEIERLQIVDSNYLYYYIIPNICLVKTTDGNYLCSWSIETETGISLYAQRLDSFGELSGTKILLNPPKINCLLISLTTDGSNAFIAWTNHNFRSGIAGFYMTKLLPDNRLPWEIPHWVNSDLSYCYNPIFIPDQQGGCYASWAENSYSGYSLHAQHIDTSGSKLGTSEMENVCDSSFASSTHSSILHNGHLIMSWVNKRGNESYLYTQVIDVPGRKLLRKNGLPLVGGFSGEIQNFKVLTRGTNTLVLWEEQVSEYNYQIRLQELDINGVKKYPKSGLLLTYTHYPYLECSITPAGELLLLFQNGQSYDYYLSLQIFDTSYKSLYGEQGFRLNPSGGNIESVKIHVLDNGNYLIGWVQWTMWGETFHAQLFSHNQPMWGVNGTIVDATYNIRPKLLSIDDHYFFWSSQYTDSIYLTKLDDNGNLAPGWTSSVKLAEGDYFYHLKGIVSDDGGFIAYWEYNTTDSENDIYIQRVYPDGTLAYDMTGSPLVSNTYNDSYPTLTYSENGYDLVWGYGTGEEQSYRYQHFNTNFEPKYGSRGKELYSADVDFRDSKLIPVTIKDENGVIFFGNKVCERPWNMEIRMQYISNHGKQLWGDSGIPLAHAVYDQSLPEVAVMDENNMVAVWKDARSNINEEGSNTMLFAQRFHIDRIELDNPEITRPLQLTNYPNPFNPITTISFKIPNYGLAQLDILNIRGQKVKTILDMKMSSGQYQFDWNGKDENDKRVASGVYLLYLKINGITETRKMVLVK